MVRADLNVCAEITGIMSKKSEKSEKDHDMFIKATPLVIITTK